MDLVSKCQEAILTIPHGVTQLVDMLMDHEEIQKILVFEGAFVKIFSIIKEEGSSEGGVVVQDCLELLNNLPRNNTANQRYKGFDPLISILRLKGSNYEFTRQQIVILLSVLETIQLLVNGDPEADPGKDINRLTNKTVLVQKKVLDHLLMLGVESQWAPAPLRCAALQCIGELIVGRPQNHDSLASKVLGEESHVERALTSLLRIILHTSSVQVFVSADYVFKCFCEKNPDGQTMLASTLIPQPQLMVHAPFEDNIHMSFGRAAIVLSHVLKDNIQCKERVLRIELEAPKPSLKGPEPLMHCMLSMAEIEDVDENEAIDQKNDHPLLVSTFDSQFVCFVKHLKEEIRDEKVEIYSHPKSQVAVVPAELEQRNGETDGDYIKQLKTFVERQCLEIQNLLGRNATLAEDLVRTGGSELNDMLVGLGQEQSKVERLSARLMELGEDVEKLLEGIGDDTDS